ncbi:hypothetical protein [Evansella halocellulosilytica]|uniref:hypothetical protein n=1 Tax=Evansella halocellulosilytica TaxID=2011013 RepID=UPI000BB7303A|nr:hypothetical protein [Evansella halocellulosilytica]
METKINKFFIFLGVIWTLLFAGMSFYWAMGGMIGVRSLGGAIYEQSLSPVGILDFDLDRHATLWRLLFWEPYWMIGGICYFFSIKKIK